MVGRASLVPCLRSREPFAIVFCVGPQESLVLGVPGILLLMDTLCLTFKNRWSFDVFGALDVWYLDPLRGRCQYFWVSYFTCTYILYLKLWSPYALDSVFSAAQCWQLLLFYLVLCEADMAFGGCGRYSQCVGALVVQQMPLQPARVLAFCSSA